MRPPESGTATAPRPDPAEAESGRAEPETRRALRVARRQRRHLATFCALAVAACLVLTVLIVSLARDRAPGAVSGQPLLVAAAPAGL